MLTSSTKREFGHLHVVVVQWRAKKWTKKRAARAKLLFCQSTTFAFLPFSLTSLSGTLSNDNDDDYGGENVDKKNEFAFFQT